MPRTVVEIRYNHFPRIANALGREAREIVQKTAFEIEAGAKQIVPVDTGALKNSIQTEPEGNAAMVVYTNQEYAAFVEHGTGRQASQPYMTPAAEQARPGFMAAFRDLENRLA